MRGPHSRSGIAQKQGAAHWKWVDGRPWTLTNWAPNQPDSANGQQNRVQMWNNPPGSWDDLQQVLAAAADGAGAARAVLALRAPLPLQCPAGHVLLHRAAGSSDWACDLRAGGLHPHPGGCLRGCTGFRQSSGWERWTCRACDFDMCDKCYERAQGTAPGAPAESCKLRALQLFDLLWDETLEPDGAARMARRQLGETTRQSAGRQSRS